MKQVIKSRILLWILAITGMLMTACRSQAPQSSVSQPSGKVPLIVEESIRMPMDSSSAVYDGLLQKDLVIGFYKQRNFAPAFYSGSKRVEIGDSLVSLLGRIRYYGLPPARYHVAEINTSSNLEREAILRHEALISDAFISILQDIRLGCLHAPGTIDSTSDRSLARILSGESLHNILVSEELHVAEYFRLKDALKDVLNSLPQDERAKVLKGGKCQSIIMQQRLEAIEINLERWRSEQGRFDARYVIINIPSFQLTVLQDGAVTFQSRVIVGNPQTPTPVLSSAIECIVTYPYWHVPRKIAIEEYLPLIQQDTSFLRLNNFDVLDRKGNMLKPDSIQWISFNKNYFPVSLRQREGEENSLGVIKFIFDNPYAVFLHDTNARNLFKKERRAFSHGCIRVERAVELGHYLVTGDLNKKSLEVDKYLAQEERHSINLRYPVPIYVRYYTCEVLQDHSLVMYDDIYELDDAIKRVLYP